MKLRIRGNSLRLRLSRTDLSRFESEGLVEEEIVFGTGLGQRLTYRLRKADAESWNVDFSGSTLTICVPDASARDWISSEETGMHTEKQIDNGGRLQILVERDFACLSPRQGEDDKDTFEHPGLTAAC